jgi:hypothetical protein
LLFAWVIGTAVLKRAASGEWTFAMLTSHLDGTAGVGHASERACPCFGKQDVFNVSLPDNRSPNYSGDTNG